MNKIHSQIQYKRQDGCWVHSDTCPHNCEIENINDYIIDEESKFTYRDYLHDVLDEYLDNVKLHGRGYFYIGNHQDIEPLI